MASGARFRGGSRDCQNRPGCGIIKYSILNFGTARCLPLKQPLVSVIVPVYNVEPYLGPCLESLRAQTYPDLEVLLVKFRNAAVSKWS